MANIIAKKKFRSLILLNYSPELEKFLYWYQQLIAESLGKKNKGILPKVEKASMGKSFGPPPERGPQPQGMKKGDFIGCPYRENGVKSDIKGISDIQVKGKKFIGVK